MPDRALPEIVESTVAFESHAFDVARAVIRFPDGREAERVSVLHPGAVALVVIDDQQRWLLVRQYRHPAQRELLEIPAGTRERDEAPEQTVAREVREETGYSPRSLIRRRPIFACATTPGAGSAWRSATRIPMDGPPRAGGT